MPNDLSWRVCLILAAGVVLPMAGFSQASAAFYLPWSALPPGYRAPAGPDPEADFRRPHPVGKLRLAERNAVFHFVQLDQSPGNWADNVLRVVVGFADHWGPKDYYAVLPEGYRAEPGRAVVFMSTRKIKFGEVLKSDAAKPLRSTSDPRYTLARVGEHIVVTRGAQRRWYFETPDQGESWRIAMVEEVQRPGRFTRMEYLNDLIVAVKYPNGQQATIDYENGRPVRIQTPFGQRAEIHREAGGYITKVEVFRDEEGFDPGPPGRWAEQDQPRRREPRPEPAVTHTYERNAEGRITRYTDPLSRTFRVDYQVDQSEEAKLEKVVYLARITNEGDGSFMERRHEARPKQKEWFIADRYGPMPKQPGGSRDDADASLEHEVRLVEVNKRWTVVGRSRGNQQRQTNIKVDKRGLPETEVGPTGLTKVTEHDEAGNPVKVVESDGRARVSTYNAFGQPLSRIDAQGRQTLHTYDEHGRLLSRIDPHGRESYYEYGPAGFPIASEDRDRRYEFEFDQWGRMIAAAREGGPAARWAYNRFGDLESVTQTSPASLGDMSGAPEEAGQTTTYLRDERGRLVTIAYPDGTADQISYNPAGRLHAVVRPDDTRVRYRYDEAGRISHKQAPARRFEAWTYYPNGRVLTHRFRDADQKRWTEKRFGPEGKLLTERVTGEPPLRNTYDKLGRLVRTDHPDGTWSEFGYDERNRLIAVRGTHQDPVNYRYENNRRITELVEAESQESK